MVLLQVMDETERRRQAKVNWQRNYTLNKDKILNRKKIYYEENRVRICARARELRKHPERSRDFNGRGKQSPRELAKKKSEYYHTNKEHLLKKARKRRRNLTPEEKLHKLEVLKKWRAKNPVKTSTFYRRGRNEKAENRLLFNKVMEQLLSFRCNVGDTDENVELCEPNTAIAEHYFMEDYACVARRIFEMIDDEVCYPGFKRFSLLISRRAVSGRIRGLHFDKKPRKFVIH